MINKMSQHKYTVKFSHDTKRCAVVLVLSDSEDLVIASKSKELKNVEVDVEFLIEKNVLIEVKKGKHHYQFVDKVLDGDGKIIDLNPDYIKVQSQAKSEGKVYAITYNGMAYRYGETINNNVITYNVLEPKEVKIQVKEVPKSMPTLVIDDDDDREEEEKPKRNAFSSAVTKRNFFDTPTPVFNKQPNKFFQPKEESRPVMPKVGGLIKGNDNDMTKLISLFEQQVDLQTQIVKLMVKMSSK